LSVTTGGPATLPRAHAPRPAEPKGVVAHDDILQQDEQKTLLSYLKGPGWAYGAFSDPEGARYWFKHFAGIVNDGREGVDPEAFEETLESTAPLVAQLWRRLKAGPMAGHKLTRCYANGYPAGAEGGLHRDSYLPNHFTAIYYPHLSWKPNYAGETVFFDAAEQEIIASVYPRPNRLVVFPGLMPHVARGVSRACPEMRITLMFKTMI
jgi:SM-20-related protein